MIEHSEAQALVRKTEAKLPARIVAVAAASGHYLAEDVYAPHDHPFFDQSAMDGYAMAADTVKADTALPVVMEIAAGQAAQNALPAGEIARIFTGAAVPAGADTVIPQELTTPNEGTVTIHDKILKIGSNVRRKGEQIQQGQLALAAGTMMSPAAIGFLASIGVLEVAIQQRPSVGVLTTGSEFATSADELAEGKIFESNSGMLGAMLKEAGFSAEALIAEDDPSTMKDRLRHLAQEHPVIITTGGVSVGKYDYTKQCLEDLGFETVFHKVNQKPGKPLLFMRKGEQLAFGLPGNPRAVFISFYEYVLPCLQTMAGSNSPGLRQLTLPLAEDVSKRDNKTHFRSVYLRDGKASVRGGQQSHMLGSLTEADGWIVFSGPSGTLSAGTPVQVNLLPKI